MRNRVIECAKKYDADVVTITSADKFSKDSALFKIFPEVKTVIGLGFRVLRGMYRGVEEGTVYYQYTTMGVENLEETVMPFAMLQVASVIEREDYIALPQRRHQTIMKEENSTNPEVDYTDIFRGITAENQLDFEETAVICGIGEKGVGGRIINKEYGPFIRYCFVLTDAEIEETPKEIYNLCDNCGECIKACPGHAISDEGEVDPWRCAVYYNGANGSKNPFMPPAKHFYRSSICGRACDRACYIHLEEKGLLSKTFKKKFRNGENWELDTKQFETLKREKEWNFTQKK